MTDLHPSSDPIVEFMLQSVPDPFDSYGPPQAEDQIFSILAPLSIMTAQSKSSSPSPMRGASELDSSETSDKITSWLPTASSSNGTFYSSEVTDWAGVPSPTSASPPQSISPPNHAVSRKHLTTSNHQRKAESKLRSVLSAIDESRTNTHEDEPDCSHRTTTVNGTSPPPDTGQSGWTSTLGTSFGNGTADEDARTPSHSFPTTTNLPSDRIETPEDDETQTPMKL